MDSDSDMNSDLGGFDDPFEAARRATAPAQDDQRGSTCEIKTYERRYNAGGHSVMLQAGKHSKARLIRDRDHDAAIVLVKYYDKDAQLTHTETRIQSPHVKAAMRAVLKDYPGVSFNASHVVIHNKPKCFFHYRKEFVAYCSSLEDAGAVQHMNFALNYMLETLQAETMSWFLWAEPMEGLDQGLEFENLWMAFRPGCLLFRRIGDLDTVLRLETMEFRESAVVNMANSWNLTTSNTASDGTSFGRQHGHACIGQYDFYKPFKELPVYPLEYHPTGQAVYAAAVERGRKYIGLRGVHYCKSTGTAELLSPFRAQTTDGEEDYHPLRTTTVNSRIIVDSKGFADANPNQSPYLYSIYKKTDLDDILEYSVSDDEYAVCKSSIPGFSLREKRWGFFEVNDITRIDFSDEAFDKLILPRGQKQLILSLVQAHGNDRSGFDDLIQGKGKGMIFLLHGVAGVGKTITAESVAERTRQPLYVVGSGDFGVDVNTVEEKLSAILSRATRWNAIILIDEADVFLEKRSVTHLKRNGLVSVFLRVLEYYEGIMFLTTNRVKQFDKAFKSRIHMAIHYPRLDSASRRELWHTFVTRGVNGSIPLWLNDDCLDTLAANPLNGRQIKNVVRMSLALATAADTDLERKHLEASIESMRSFDAVMGSDSDDNNSADELDDEDIRQEVPRKRLRAR